MNWALTKTHKTIIIMFLVGAVLLSSTPVVFAQSFNQQINYQGKLTDENGATVADGTYNIAFNLYGSASSGVSLWSSTTTVGVTNGLFSYMLGSDDSIAGVDFDQTLYLGVNIGGIGAAVWDGEMTPRKVFGAVPAAFVAQEANNAATVGGVASTSFLRNDIANAASALLSFTAGFISNSSSTITELTTGTTTVTTLSIDGEEYTTISGGSSGLTNNSGTLTVNIDESHLNIAGAPTDDYVLMASSTSAGGFAWNLIGPDSVQPDSQVDEYCLTYEAGDQWQWQDCSAGAYNLGDLSNVNTDNVVGGDILMFNGSFWATTSTSTLLTELELNTEAELESLLGDVTNVFTNNDTIGVTNGGTGASTFSIGQLLVGNGTSAVTSTTTAGLKESLALNLVENTALSTWAGSSNITTTGALNSGSITSGFGNIDIGSSNLDADGTITFGGISDGIIQANGGVLSASTTISSSAIQDAFLRNNADDTTTGELTAANFISTDAAATTTLAGGLQVDTNGLVYDYANNRVGIGTISPSHKLTVGGVGDQDGLLIQSDTQDAYLVLDSAGDAGDWSRLDFRDNGVSDFYIRTGNGSGDVNMNVVSGDLYIQRNGVTNLFMGSGNNVGIGTTNPSTKLDVLGTASSSDLIVDNTVQLLGINSGLLQVDASGNVSASSTLGSNLLPTEVLVDSDIGSTVQAWDTDLDTWAGVTPSANGQSLVSAANYAAMRTLLDLEAGTDFYSISAADAAFEGELNNEAGLYAALSDVSDFYQPGEALNSGSITSGFGNIDNGSSNLTSGGTVTFAGLNNGGFLKTNASGVLSTSTVTTADLDVANGTTDEYCLTYESDTTNFQWQDCGGGSINLGDLGDVNTTNAIAGDILMYTGSGWATTSTSTLITAAELAAWAGSSNITTVGTLAAGAITSTFGNIDIGSSNLDADGTITFGGISDGIIQANGGVLTASTTISSSAIQDAFLRNNADDTTTGELTAANFISTDAAATTTLAGGLAVDANGLVYNYSTGNVGIGTAGPAYKLTVDAGDIALDRGQKIRFVSETTGNNSATIGSNTSNELIFTTNGTAEQMRILTTGNVGIGTTSPSAALEISRNSQNFTALKLTRSGTSPGSLAFGVSTAGASTISGDYTMTFKSGNATSIIFGDGSDTNMVISGSGNVGIGDTSPAAALTVGNGDLFQVNSSGAIAAATGLTTSGSVQFSGITSGLLAANGSGVVSASSTIADSLLSSNVSLLGSTINANELASEDFGDFTCNGTTCTLDATYLTGNQTITLSGDVTGSGATSITTTIASGAVDPAMLASTDFGAFTVSAGSASLDDGTVSTSTLLTGGTYTNGYVLTASSTAPGGFAWEAIPSGVTDHGALTGLTDDDHTQYALLAGRSGGQTLIGGTGTTDDLTFKTTSGVGATGADMHFLVGNNGATEAMTILNNGNVGVGTTSPNAKFTVEGAEDTALLALSDSTNNVQANVYTGTTTPNGRVSAPRGSLFIDTSSAAMYQNTDGGTSWNPFTQGTTTHMAKMTRNAVQSISNSSWIKIAFDNIEFDTGGIADATTNDRFDIKKDGRYMITSQWSVPGTLDDGDAVVTSIYINGSTVTDSIGRVAGTNKSLGVTATEIFDLQAGDYIEMYVYHEDSGAIDTETSDARKPTMSVIELAPSGGTGIDLFTDSGSDTYLTSTSDNLLIGTTTNAATAKFVLRQQNANDIVNIFDGSTEVFTILDGGNVGIGLTSPSTKLDVLGTASSSDLVIDNTVQFLNINSGLLQVDASGNVSASTTLGSNLLPTDVLVDSDIGSTIQAWDTDLDTWAGVTPGTGVATALAVNVGTAGSFVVNGGALGTPSSGTLTNASGLPIVGGTTGTLTVGRGGTGATTLSTGQLLVGNGTSAVTSTTTAGLKESLALNLVENTALSTWAGSSNITTTGALNSGSITSGFGNIDIGSSNLDADGTITFGGISDGIIQANGGVLSASTTISSSAIQDAYVLNTGDTMTGALTIQTDGQQLTIEPSTSISNDAVVEIRGHRNGSTLSNQAQLLFSNYDNDLAGTNNLGLITGRVSNDTTNIGDLVFYTYSDGSTPAETLRLTSTNVIEMTGSIDANGSFVLGDNGDAGAIDTSSWDISSAGVASGFTGLTTSGSVQFSGITSGLLEVDGSGNVSASTTIGHNLLPTDVTLLGNTVTGSGSIVLATSPTLVTPNLGTPSTLVGTNITGTASGLSIGGNAGTATALETARTIAGVSFDGTANISLNNNAITNGAGYITSADDTVSEAELDDAFAGGGTGIVFFDDATDTVSASGTISAAYLDSSVLTAGDIGSTIQAYDADLDTWAGVTPSANGQSLVSAANYAAMRTLLDLEAGTDFYSISAADAAFEGELNNEAGLYAALSDVTQFWEAGDTLSSGSISSGFGAIDVGTSAITGGVITAATGFMPDANDGAYLGQSGTAFSDLFLASGGVINWNAGDVTMTHSANALAFSGATSGYSFSDGSVGIGTTTPEAILHIENTGLSGRVDAGIKQDIGLSNSTLNAVQLGNNSYITMDSTATSTVLGNLLRIQDDTAALGNLVRGVEVQTDKGTNTQGENTALSGFARTFGVRAFTSATAGGTYEPAAGFFDLGGSGTQGNAIRAYSNDITTSELLSLFHEDTAFEGTGLLMNFGNDTGSFASTSSKFVDLQNAGTSKFTVSAHGTTTIGDGTTGNAAGLVVGYGGICADDDGTCTPTLGEVTAVTVNQAHSDLAEMYFSAEDLEPGELVVTDGFISIARANGENGQVLGVVSTKPGSLLGYNDTPLKAGQGYPLALSGRVPVKLSTENGPIAVGDPLTLSSLPGIAMKAEDADEIVGYSLEDFDGTYAYTEGFVNQFGDDIAEPNYEATNVNTKAKEVNPCYYGGGGAIDDEEVEDCDPNAVIEDLTDEGSTEEEIALARYEAEQEALEALRYEPADSYKVDGETVKVGTVTMFVDRGIHLASGQIDILNELTSTSTDLVLGAKKGSDETLWDRLKVLAQNFVDGVLAVTGLKADKVETSELCVDDVCVTADDLRALLEGSSANNNSTNTSSGSTQNSQESSDVGNNSTTNEDENPGSSTEETADETVGDATETDSTNEGVVTETDGEVTEEDSSTNEGSVENGEETEAEGDTIVVSSGTVDEADFGEDVVADETITEEEVVEDATENTSEEVAEEENIEEVEPETEVVEESEPEPQPAPAPQEETVE